MLNEKVLHDAEKVRASLFETELVRYDVPNYAQPQTWGVYKKGGQTWLGSVGKKFNPLAQESMLDTLLKAIDESGLAVQGLTFRELMGGKRVQFELLVPNMELHTPMAGDVTMVRLLLRAGYDGGMALALTYSLFRLWCGNGSGSYEKERNIAYAKNTTNGQENLALKASDLLKVMAQTEGYAKKMEELIHIKYTDTMLDEFLTELLGYDVTEEELHGRKQKRLDALREAIAVETDNTGMNAFSVLQGVTRFGTHHTANGDAFSDSVFMGTAALMNNRAARLLIPA